MVTPERAHKGLLINQARTKKTENAPMLPGLITAEHSNNPMDSLLYLQYAAWAQQSLKEELKGAPEEAPKKLRTPITNNASVRQLIAPHKPERREIHMKRELINQAYVYGLVSLVVLVSVPVLRFVHQLV